MKIQDDRTICEEKVKHTKLLLLFGLTHFDVGDILKLGKFLSLTVRKRSDSIVRLKYSNA